jgi:hypothetical protein
MRGYQETAEEYRLLGCDSCSLVGVYQVLEEH